MQSKGFVLSDLTRCQIQATLEDFDLYSTAFQIKINVMLTFKIEKVSEHLGDPILNQIFSFMGHPWRRCHSTPLAPYGVLGQK